jgi:hypothetical protein
MANGKPFRVATFIAPGPPPPVQPKGVRLVRRGSRLDISWSRVPVAARYVVRAILRDGRSLMFLVRSSTRSVTVPAVPPYDAGRVIVAALDAYNHLGPAANVTLHALAPTCARPRAVHGKLVCAQPNHKQRRHKR